MPATFLLIAASLIVRAPDAPIRRPPNNHDELCDARDYYPDALLEEYRRSVVITDTPAAFEPR